MKKILRLLTIMMITVVLSVFIIGCDDKEIVKAYNYTPIAIEDNVGRTVQQIKDSGYIRIGVFSDAMPFGYQNSIGDYEGFDVELAREFGKKLNVEPIFVKLRTLDDRILFLEEDKVDIVFANFTITDEREEYVDFSIPYMKTYIAIISDEDNLITDISQLYGEKLIVIKDSSAELFFQQNYPEIELISSSDDIDVYNNLLDEKGIALVNDCVELVIWSLQNDGYEIGIQSVGNIDFIGGAVKDGNKDLQSFANSVLEDLMYTDFFYDNYEKNLDETFGNTIPADDLLININDIK